MMNPEIDAYIPKAAAPIAASTGEEMYRPADLLIAGIGASSGGLAAIDELLDALPGEVEMAFVIIVHLSPEHESQMAELLQRHTRMPVTQVTGPLQVRAGHVYVIPPGKNLGITDGHLNLSDRSTTGHAPIDMFFRALGETYGPNAIGIVLSGAGHDGAHGLEYIKTNGGLTMAQSPQEAQFPEMPQSAIATGKVDVVRSVAEIARFLRDYDPHRDENDRDDATKTLAPDGRSTLTELLAHLRAQTGHDFTHYRESTVLRRLDRRINFTGADDLPSYLTYLKENDDEVNHLLKDLLLVVTSFFRDPEAFEVIRKDVVPELFQGDVREEGVRAWVCGCATGEEAYSVAMLLNEEAERVGHLTPSRVFASDIAEHALTVARTGEYPDAISSQVSGDRLHRFFDKTRTGFRIKRKMRDEIVFANHDLLRDPPFSRLDLITCRNVLIYLNRSIHGHAIDLFHYSLKPGGYLLIGKSESIDSTKHFRAVDKQNGIYQRTAGKSVIRPALSLPIPPAAQKRRDDHQPASLLDPPDIEVLHREIVTPYVPPSLIVNDRYEVVHTLGGGEKYLSFSTGRPTQDILKVVREELRLDMRYALFNTFKKGERTLSRPISVRVDGTTHVVELLVEPVTVADLDGTHVHVLLRDVEDLSSTEAQADSVDGQRDEEPKDIQATLQTIRKLETELDYLRAQLQSSTEEYDASNERLQASNEEMLSVNEELRSTAEELESSREELQSMNEELRALNAELEGKVDEVKAANGDLQNLMNATDIGTIFLDQRQCITRYTPRVEELFEIAHGDLGRPLADLTHRLGSRTLPDDAARVTRDHAMIEREVQHESSRRWYLVRLRPYQTIAGDVEGTVITFVDVTEKKKYDEQLETLVDTLEELLKDRVAQIKRLASELILSEQSERQRIAQILHDDLQQLLYAFQMRVAMLRKNLPQEQAARLEEANALIDRALDVTRTLTVELSPPVLKSDDITTSLEWLALRMEEMHDLKVEVRSPTPLIVPFHARVLVYQIVRELLFNVVKHAETKQARVSLAREDGQLIVTVADDGAGFDAAVESYTHSATTSGYGLSSVRDRLELLGGNLEGVSAPGRGTRMTLHLPFASMPTTDASLDGAGGVQ